MKNSVPSDRLLKTAPLVLRLGLAAILIHSGIGQIAPMFTAETNQSLAADSSGVAVSANWATVIGAAQVAVGGFLLAGFFTRLMSLGMLASIGYAAYDSYNGASGETLNYVAQAFNENRGAILLLAAAFGSLLVSGAGCVGIDCRKRHGALADQVTV